ncbi:MAG: hypothetical protein AAF446_08480, partial [Pseudomonadota bacterium]
AMEKEIDSGPKKTNVNLCAETSVLHGWTTYSEYLDNENKPKVIPITGGSGTFQGLVCSRVGRNVTSKTVLDRLLESGNVEIVDKNFVQIIDRFFQPIKPSEYVVLDVGSNAISRLAQTIVHNLKAVHDEDRNLQQVRWCRSIPTQQLGEVSKRIRKMIKRNILEIEEILDAAEVNDEQENVSLLGAGWFVFKS